MQHVIPLYLRWRVPGAGLKAYLAIGAIWPYLIALDCRHLRIVHLGYNF
jgi:hypothetical protein